MHPRTVFVLSGRLQRVIALTTEPARRAWGITDTDLSSEDFARCQEVATTAAGQGVEALRWPSATGTGESVAVFWDNRQPGTHINLVEEYLLEWEWLEAIAGGTPLTTFLPRLLRYSLYEQ